MEHVSTVRVTYLLLFSMHALLCFFSSEDSCSASLVTLVPRSLLREHTILCLPRLVFCCYIYILQISDKLTVLSQPALCYQHGWGCCNWPGVRSRRSNLFQVWTIPKKDPSPARSLRGRHKRDHSWRTAQVLWNTGNQFVPRPGTL